MQLLTLSLNPYCNGRCSLGYIKKEIKAAKGNVLILIVMEDVLWGMLTLPTEKIPATS